MLLLITILLIAIICFIFKFRERLAFQYGRLSRPYDQTTRMGSDQFIELSFGKVHYIYQSSTNATSSTLNIFVHGFSIAMEMWQDIFPSLVHDNQSCLVLDLYGRGWSDAPDVPMNVDLFVSQIAELLYALNLSYEKYNLYGVSMGGVIVQRFTELYPSKVSKLILCNSTGLDIVKPSFISSIPILGALLFKFDRQSGESKSVRAQWANPDSDEYKRCIKLYQQTCQQHPGFLRSLFSTIFYFDFHLAFKSIECIQKLSVPILILWGEKDTLTPVENAYRYHNLYKTSTLKIISGANHNLLIEHSKEAIEAIKTFLKDK
ncbi:unnamed protein product [Adineta steineri]|uniref:acylglycerol lipase n=1 Tax=Adineta steineri TaxID=433720 RepID=A0A815V3T5_9BILA|nr:unnamed protein product [Adineta steineri]